LIVLGAGLRLYDLNDQPIDFHPTRQLRGAIVARGMYYALDPSADDAARQQAVAFWQSTGQYEPSILEGLVALTYLLLGKEQFWVARLFNTIFWVIGGVALFELARRMSLDSQGENSGQHTKAISNGAALLALAFYLILPFSVQASRSFQPDPGMVMWIVLAVLALYRWSEGTSWKWAILAGIFSGLAILIKAVAFYILAGAAMAVVLYTYGFLRTRPLFSPLLKIIGSAQVWCMMFLTLAPAAIYYLTQEGRASEFFSSWTVDLAHLLLQPRTYLRWLNLVGELMGFIALLVGLAGVLIAKRRNRALLLGLWAGYILYGLLLPYQITTHSYYHLQLVPILALSLIPISQLLLEYLMKQARVWRIVFAGLAVGVVVFFSWQALIPLYAEDYRDEPVYWQTIASYLPGDGKIVALTQDYGYRLMYYGWRKVVLWPNRGEQGVNQLRGSSKEFQQYFAKRTAGKSYFLITAFKQFEDQPDLKEHLYANFPVLAEGPGYIIFDLTSGASPGTQ
jgi:4-amino-4-deoxy-L-arabinose transferase-like glycosyltransferase